MNSMKLISTQVKLVTSLKRRHLKFLSIPEKLANKESKKFLMIKKRLFYYALSNSMKRINYISTQVLRVDCYYIQKHSDFCIFLILKLKYFKEKENKIIHKIYKLFITLGPSTLNKEFLSSVDWEYKIIENKSLSIDVGEIPKIVKYKEILKHLYV